MYSIELSRYVSKILVGIYKVDKKLYCRLVSAMELLAHDPFKGKKLKGPFSGDYSLRVGNYRIVYTVQKKKLIVYILDLGHRENIYLP